MTDEEKAAMEWLESMCGMRFAPKDWRPLAQTIKAMLAQPRLPEEPSEAALIAIADITGMPAANNGPGTPTYGWPERSYRALRAHLTKPKTKTVEVWRVESAYHGNTRIWQAIDGNKGDADKMAEYLAGDGHTCIRVTGPHKQAVPA